MTHRCYTVTVLMILGGAALVSLPTWAQGEENGHEQKFANEQKFTIDVALDGMTNAQVDVNPNDPNEMNMGFARGDQGVVNGSIYPAKTLQPGTRTNDPEDTQNRIGRIICRAAYIINLTEAMNGAPYASFVSELYSFDDEQHSTLIADGFGPTTNHSAYRVVVGGTGRFRNMIGDLFEENIGTNESNFCNLRMRFRLRRVQRDHDRD